MTIENKIKYASKLTEVLLKTLYRLNHYVFLDKLNRGIYYRFSVRRSTERKVSKLLREKRELEAKINNLLYGNPPRVLTCLRNRKRNAIRLVKLESISKERAI